MAWEELHKKRTLKMKKKISISISENKIKLIESLVEEGKFRNKSHALETGLDKVINEIEKQHDKI